MLARSAAASRAASLELDRDRALDPRCDLVALGEPAPEDAYPGAYIQSLGAGSTGASGSSASSGASTAASSAASSGAGGGAE